MKRHLTMAVIAVLCIGLFCSLPVLNQAQAQAKKAAVPTAAKITVLNPMGTAAAGDGKTDGGTAVHAGRQNDLPGQHGFCQYRTPYGRV